MNRTDKVFDVLLLTWEEIKKKKKSKYTKNTQKYQGVVIFLEQILSDDGETMLE